MSRPTPEDEEDDKFDKKSQQLQSVELKERYLHILLKSNIQLWLQFISDLPIHFSSSKSLLANVLDIDDDFRCNHSCPTFLQQPTYYRTVYRFFIISCSHVFFVIRF